MRGPNNNMGTGINKAWVAKRSKLTKFKRHHTEPTQPADQPRATAAQLARPAPPSTGPLASSASLPAFAFSDHDQDQDHGQKHDSGRNRIPLEALLPARYQSFAHKRSLSRARSLSISASPARSSRSRSRSLSILANNDDDVLRPDLHVEHAERVRAMDPETIERWLAEGKIWVRPDVPQADGGLARRGRVDTLGPRELDQLVSQGKRKRTSSTTSATSPRPKSPSSPTSSTSQQPPAKRQARMPSPSRALPAPATSSEPALAMDRAMAAMTNHLTSPRAGPERASSPSPRGADRTRSTRRGSHPLLSPTAAPETTQMVVSPTHGPASLPPSFGFSMARGAVPPPPFPSSLSSGPSTTTAKVPAAAFVFAPAAAASGQSATEEDRDDVGAMDHGLATPPSASNDTSDQDDSDDSDDNEQQGLTYSFPTPPHSGAPASTRRAPGPKFTFPAAPALTTGLAAAAPANSWAQLNLPRPQGWTCNECMSQNPVGENKCLACETPQSPAEMAGGSGGGSGGGSQEGAGGAAPGSPSSETVGFGGGFGASGVGSAGGSLAGPGSGQTTGSSAQGGFTLVAAMGAPAGLNPLAQFMASAARAGEWTCATCMVKNKPDANKCVSCETSRPRTASSSQAAAAPVPPGAASGTEPNPLARFMAPSNDWTCSVCAVKNKVDASKCISCETPKPGVSSAAAAAAAPAAFQAPPAAPAPTPALTTMESNPLARFMPSAVRAAGEWMCSACMVKNTANAHKCVSCETPKPGDSTVAAAPPAFVPPPAAAISDNESNPLARFMARSSGWTCSACMVKNKDDAAKCVSCETAKPGASTVAAPSTFVPPPAAAAGSGSEPNPLARFMTPSSDWTCSVCAVKNKDGATRCVSCESPKPGSGPSAASSSAPLATTAGRFGAFVPPSSAGTAASAPPPAFGGFGSGSSVASSGFVFGGAPVVAAAASGPGTSGFLLGAPAPSSGGFAFGGATATSAANATPSSGSAFGALPAGGAAASSATTPAFGGFGSFGASASGFKFGGAGDKKDEEEKDKDE